MGSLTVDLNCDMGESFGAYQLGNDEAILDYISSANIACGFHAGDPGVMRKTVQLALKKGVAIGAHPGLPDLQGFGRRNMAISAREVYELVLYQVGALWAFTQAAGCRLHHVKPHGALYNMAAQSKPLAEAVAEAVFVLDPRLLLYGLAGSELVKAAARKGLPFAQEVFADRSYQPDGTLTPREQAGALISDPDKAAKQVISMIKEGKVSPLKGSEFLIKADTVCIHGDGPHALLFARNIKEQLRQEGIQIQAIKSVA